MSPNMKDFGQRLDFNENTEPHDLKLLKALVQFSIQVESREIDLKELLKPARKTKGESNDPLPRIWRKSADHKGHGRQRSNSTEGSNDRMPLMKYWRRPALRRTHKPKEEVEGSTTLKNGNVPHDSFLDHHMSLQQQLAITALNLTAPACSTVLRNQRNNWVQLSGHPGSLAPAGPGTIWKKQPGDTNETWVYEALMRDSAREIIPKFYREVSYEGERFIEISDLLYNFNNPTMMDIKIGNRTFLESEVSNTKARNDLYKKMLKVDPNAPTAKEHEAQAITKLRYMDFRDNMSSSRSLSFRIEALKMASSSSVTELKKICSKEEVIEVLTNFIQRRESLKKRILSRLGVIKDTFENSDFFKNHEVIGSSILIVYDDTHAGAWIIDFAKTCKIPEGINIDHKSEWKQDNHEEGYLTGLENIIKCFEEVSVSKHRKIKLFCKT